MPCIDTTELHKMLASIYHDIALVLDKIEEVDKLNALREAEKGPPKKRRKKVATQTEETNKNMVVEFLDDP
jgi:hypothetical protein